MSNINDLTVAQLRRAVSIREEIESLQEQLESLIGGSSSVSAPKRRGPGRRPKAVAATEGNEEDAPRKRRMSAAGRARIAAAARARWAKFRGTSAKPAKAAKEAKAGKAPKRRFNAAARAKLSAAAKARWAKAKADGKSAL
jgi:hypothetical protein